MQSRSVYSDGEIVVHEGSIAEKALMQRFDFNLWLQEQIHSAPWWGLSLVFHLMLFLIITSFSNPYKPPEIEVPIVIPAVQDKEKKQIQVIKKIKPSELQPDPLIIKDIEHNDPVTKSTDNYKDLFTNSNVIGKGIYDTYGIGGGFGGGRPGGLNSVNIPINTATKSGLLWLARHQNSNGSWGAISFQHQCNGIKCSGTGDEQFDIGLTGLALLAFTGAGFKTNSRNREEGICFGDVVRNAADFLVHVQLPDGTFGSQRDGKFMYNQAIATYALTDLYGQSIETPAGIIFKEPAERAVKYLLKVQNPGKAWRYQPRDGQNDASVTGWVTMALKAAENYGISVPQNAFEDIKSFYDDITDSIYGKVGYTTLDSIAIKNNEDYRTIVIQPSMTAIGIMSRIFIDRNTRDPLIKLGVSQILSSLPEWDRTKSGIIDYYYWFYASYCLYQYDAPIGRSWNTWNEKIKDVLLNNQCTEKDGCAKGSWEPIDRWSSEGSRVYSTAINVLTLEVYYRLPAITSLHR